MNYPTFHDRYGPAGQANPSPQPQGPAGIAPPSQMPTEVANPWSKALDPWALEAQNPQPNISGAKV